MKHFMLLLTLGLLVAACGAEGQPGERGTKGEEGEPAQPSLVCACGLEERAVRSAWSGERIIKTCLPCEEGATTLYLSSSGGKYEIEVGEGAILRIYKQGVLDKEIELYEE